MIARWWKRKRERANPYYINYRCWWSNQSWTTTHYDVVRPQQLFYLTLTHEKSQWILKKKSILKNGLNDIINPDKTTELHFRYSHFSTLEKFSYLIFRVNLHHITPKRVISPSQELPGSQPLSGDPRKGILISSVAATIAILTHCKFICQTAVITFPYNRKLPPPFSISRWDLFDTGCLKMSERSDGLTRGEMCQNIS